MQKPSAALASGVAVGHLSLLEVGAAAVVTAPIPASSFVCVWELG